MTNLKHLAKKLNLLIVLVAFDLAALYISLGMGVVLREQFLPNILDFLPVDLQINFYFFSLWWIPTLYLIVFWSENLYSKQKPFWDEVKTLWKAVIITAILVYAVISLGKLSTEVSRVVLIIQPLLAMLLLPLIRRVVKITMFKLKLRGYSALLVNLNGPSTIQADFVANPYIGYRIKGILQIKNTDWNLQKLIKQITTATKKYQADVVIIGTNHMENHRFSSLIQQLYFIIPHLLIIPKNLSIDIRNSEIYHMTFNNLFVLDIKKGINEPANLFIKRGIDIIGSILLLIVALPLSLIIIILIFLEDQGGPIYTSERFGRDGKTFKFYKFRSMIKNSEDILIKYLKNNSSEAKQWQKYRKLSYDPRITKIGKFIRAVSLDELPQLINILKGDMSFIGPRAYLPREKEDMGKYWQRILAVKPGLSGLWQVSGRSELTFVKRMKLDVSYVQNWSFWLDFVIAIKTLKILTSKMGAK